MIKKITVLGTDEDGKMVRHEATTQEELDAIVPPTIHGGLEHEKFYEHDLTDLMKELELKYVPVEACNELAVLINPIPPHVKKIFEKMDYVCSHASVKTKIGMLEELPPLAIYYALKHGGFKQMTVWNKAYKLMGREFRLLLEDEAA